MDEKLHKRLTTLQKQRIYMLKRQEFFGKNCLIFNVFELQQFFLPNFGVA